MTMGSSSSPAASPTPSSKSTTASTISGSSLSVVSTPSVPSSYSWLRRKPLRVVEAQLRAQHQQQHLKADGLSNNNNNNNNSPTPHLSLFDLVSLGVGGTVGSGVFVLAGYVAHNMAGPSTALSFAVAGLAACCSGVCYAELGCRLPGSTYTFAYVALNELAAVWAVACLTLEYVVSGAAVARSWGQKVGIWTKELGLRSGDGWLSDSTLDPMAFLICVATTALVVKGVEESKAVTNVFSALKVGLVVLMTVGGFFYFQEEHIVDDFMPHGVPGVLRGASSCFFAFLGYDQVCVMAGEAKNPKRDVPRAVLLTLLVVTILYIVAVISLTGMLPSSKIDDTSAFSEAFFSLDNQVLGQIVATGEIVTLPVVVLVSLVAQPRLLQSMAVDGLLPEMFRHSLRPGSWFAGGCMTMLATFVPFIYLNDLISAGILVAFSMTNSCLVLLRCDQTNNALHVYLLVFNCLCFITGVVLTRVDSLLPSVLCCCLTLGTFAYMWKKCPRVRVFGGTMLSGTSSMGGDDEGFFETPLVPFVPCLGIFVNWYLIAQQSLFGLVLLMLYLGVTTLLYCACCRNSEPAWRRNGRIMQGLDVDDTESEEAISLQRLT